MYFLFDIGGTNTRTALSDGQSLSNIKSFPSPKDFEEMLDLLTKSAQTSQKITAVSGCSRGVLDKNKSILTDMSFFGWENKPLKEELQNKLGAPVFLENDAVLAGLGEAVSGAGRNHKIVAYFTISTQVGGARIVNGKIDQSALGFEPGNQIIDIDSKLTWEQQIGGAALEKKYNQKPEDIDDQNIWHQVSKYLAVGLNNAVVYWSPDIIVLGGSVMKSIPIDVVNHLLKQTLKIFPKIPPLKKAELNESSGLYGALEYLKQVSTCK